MDQFTKVFLGFEHDCKWGVFGRVKHYYGVIEAQNRGSLHLHIIIWLEGALSPLMIQQRCNGEPEFKKCLFGWLESIFKHELPDGTVAVDSESRGDRTRCLLSRPPHPDLLNFNVVWPQFLREVLDASGQVHSHSETCYKNIAVSMAALQPADRDRFCRFNYPYEIILETSMDEDGRIYPKRLDGNVVGHNPTISGSFQCNTDGKFIGSGLLGMALSIYMSNYTAKASLDSAIMISALSAALKSLKLSEKSDSLTFDEEQCRKLILKTLNQSNGRRELSAQQVASTLLGYPNHISDARFSVFYWTKLLTWLSPEEFPPYRPTQASESISDSDTDPDHR
ncbi:hypothetical protein C8J56DRAFT_779364 [Mycena floridula]|nr:hypothetical protein C8J56DRAFT_779364 [Mycena floridula]